VGRQIQNGLSNFALMTGPRSWRSAVSRLDRCGTGCRRRAHDPAARQSPHVRHDPEVQSHRRGRERGYRAPQVRRTEAASLAREFKQQIVSRGSAPDSDGPRWHPTRAGSVREQLRARIQVGFPRLHRQRDELNCGVKAPAWLAGSARHGHCSLVVDAAGRVDRPEVAGAALAVHGPSDLLDRSRSGTDF